MRSHRETTDVHAGASDEGGTGAGTGAGRASADATDDLFLGDQLIIRQPVNGYRAGTDAVLLAASLPTNTQMDVLDVGAGVGTVSLCMAARLDQPRITLFERQPELVTLARWNVERNGFAGRLSAITGDAACYIAGGVEGECALRDESFDVVVSNPPFHDADRGTRASSALKAVSHALHDVTLDDWARFLARMARPGGACILIHKADALDALLDALAGRFGRLIVTPVYPRTGQPAVRVLVSGIKGSRAPMKLNPGLILHGDGHAFRPDIDAVMRRGAPLPGLAVV